MNEIINETHTSTLARDADGEGKKIYSPNQILGGSIWGGPIAAVYLVWKNYLALGKVAYAKKALVLGILAVVAILVGLPFIPEKFPNMVIPLTYSLAAKQLAIATQLDKRQIEDADNYFLHSNWRVFGIGTFTLFLFLVAAVLVMFVLDSVNIINLA